MPRSNLVSTLALTGIVAATTLPGCKENDGPPIDSTNVVHVEAVDEVNPIEQRILEIIFEYGMQQTNSNFTVVDLIIAAKVDEDEMKLMADHYEQKDQYGTAFDLFELASDREGMLRIAEYMLDNTFIGNAEKLFQRAGATVDNADYTRLGNVAWAKGKTNEALRLYRKADNWGAIDRVIEESTEAGLTIAFEFFTEVGDKNYATKIAIKAFVEQDWETLGRGMLNYLDLTPIEQLYISRGDYQLTQNRERLALAAYGEAIDLKANPYTGLMAEMYEQSLVTLTPLITNPRMQE